MLDGITIAFSLEGGVGENMKRVLFFTLLVFIMPVLFYGCGSSSPTTPTSPPVAIEGLDGQSGIDVGSKFAYTHATDLDCSTASSSSCFIVQSRCNTTACASGNSDALTSTVTCSEAVVDISLSNSLVNESTYCACITSDLLDANGTPVTPILAEFTTESQSSASLSVTSVTDAAGAMIGTTGSKGVFPTSFNVTFSDTTDSGLVTAADNITLVCSGTKKNITVAATGVANKYAVTVTDTDMYEYALRECVLTVTTGTGLASNATYTFTNWCAVSDGFAADSQRCWGVSDYAESTFDTWAEVLYNAVTNPGGPLTFNTTTSTLDYDSTRYGAPSYFAIQKAGTTVDPAFELILHFELLEGFDTVGVSADSMSVCIESTTGDTICAGMHGVTDKPYCFVSYTNTSTGTSETKQTECSVIGEYYVKATVTANSIVGEERGPGEGTYAQIGSTIAEAHNLSGKTVIMEMDFSEVCPTPDSKASIYDVITSGVNVEGQY